MVGSALVLGLVVEQLTGLHSLETRESVESFLAEPPGSDLDLGVDGVLSIIRVLCMIAAGCATAAGILGYQVMRRSRSARLVLSILAVPLFLAGMVTGGFAPAVVAASALMLWLQPARDWFSGVQTPAAGAPPVRPPAMPVTSAPPSVTHSPVGTPPAEAAPYAGAPRPSGVIWACVLTWVFAGLTALLTGASAVALAVDRDLLLDEVHRQNPDLADQGVTDTMLVSATYVMVAAIVLWCLAAAAVAVLVMRRMEWARIVLITSTAMVVALTLAASLLGVFLLVVPLLGAVATIALLLRPESAAWFSRAPSSRVDSP